MVGTGGAGGHEERCETDRRGVLVQNGRGRVHEPMVPLFSLSHPLLHPSSCLSLSLSVFRYRFLRVPLLTFSVSLTLAFPLSCSLLLSLSLSLSLLVGPQFFLWRGNPSMVARKPPAASLPCCFSAIPFSSPSVALLASVLFLLLSLASRSFPPSLSSAVAGSLVSSVHRPGLRILSL